MSTLFALNSGFSIKHGNTKNQPDIPYIGNGLVQIVEVEESIRHKWVKWYCYIFKKGNSCQNCFCSLVIRRLWVQSSTGQQDSFMEGLGGSVGCAVRLETRRSRVQPPPRSATFFRGDWSWNIFYGHSLPSADSRRAVVSFWRKNVHTIG